MGSKVPSLRLSHVLQALSTCSHLQGAFIEPRREGLIGPINKTSCRS